MSTPSPVSPRHHGSRRKGSQTSSQSQGVVLRKDADGTLIDDSLPVRIPPPDCKIVMLGCGGVGKTAVTLQMVQGHFLEEYHPTIEDSFRKQWSVDNQPVVLEVLDTAGQEDYSAMRDQYISMGQGFVFVYSVTDKASFSQLETYYDQVCRVLDTERFPVVLIGNKADLVIDNPQQRQVSIEGLKKVASAWGVPHFETSAKTRMNVEEVFEAVVREVRRFKDLSGQPSVLVGSTKAPSKSGSCGACTIM